MKHSIAKTIIVRIVLLSLCMITLVGAELYIFFQDLILSEARDDGLALVTQFANMVELCWNDDGKLNEKESNMLVAQLQSLCDTSKADYMYVYIPDFEKKEIQYVLVVQGKNHPMKDEEIAPGSIKKESKFYEEEYKLWDGSLDVAYIDFDNKYGKEYGTLITIDDSNGNKLAIVGVDFSYDDLNIKIILNSLFLALFLAIFIVVLNILLYRTIRKKILKPTQEISYSMNNFINGGKRSKIKIEEKHDNEFSLIVKAFNNMTDDIDEYIHNIKVLTHEQAQQTAELEIAANVQKGLLPKDNLDTDLYKIHAVMQPAKNIGGDLYDYAQIDEDNILLVIADVSGKGLSAAMFMSVTLTLIRQFAKMKFKPSEILEHTNNSLAENNPQLLFATAFIGIYNNVDKTFTYSNAGHNLPYVIRKGNLNILDKSKGVPLGMFEDEEYQQFTVNLQRGDTLYMYTDGVNEAINCRNEFYGVKRLEDLLRKYNAFCYSNIVDYVEKSLQEFSKGAVQNDDITMLTFSLWDRVELKLKAEAEELEKIKEQILTSSIPKKLKLKMCLIAEEIFINICNYAFEGRSKENTTITFLLIISEAIVMRFIDSGREYNPLKEIVDIETYDVDTQVGGLGKFITFNIADDVKYKYKDNKNILTVVKYIEEE